MMNIQALGREMSSEHYLSRTRVAAKSVRSPKGVGECWGRGVPLDRAIASGHTKRTRTRTDPALLNDV
jgi:hypothetical protein